MRCPKCKRENPARAEHCECGYDFPLGLMTGTYLAGPGDFVGDAAGIARAYNANIVAYRFGAFVIDSLVAVALLAPFHLVLGNRRAWAMLFGAAQFAYFLVLEGRWGVTLGKLATGIRVVNGRGRPPGALRALVRTVLRPIEVNPLLIGIPAGVVALLSRSKQRLGDMLAGTYVLYVDDVRRLREP